MDTEIILNQTDYDRFREFIRDKTGLDFAEDKRRMLGRGLHEVMQTASCTNLDELYTLLRRSSATSHTWDALVSTLTVGETYFFRNASHFEALARHILSELITQRAHSSRRIRIWSAGCSTGEEPYSIAILLSELIPHLESWNVSILATDINRDALLKSQAGLYGPWSFRGVDPRIQNTYFHAEGKLLAIDERIKRMVSFDYLNLVGDQFPSLINNTNAMDIILCRNVTIYFTPQVTVEVVKRFHNCLIDGGWLIPGPSEPNMVFYGDFEAKNFPGSVVYRKPAAPPPAPKRSPTFVPHNVPAFVTATPTPRPRTPARTAPISGNMSPQPASPSDAHQMALDLLQVGQADEALAKLYEMLDRHPDFVPTYYTLGKIHANKGNLDEAQHWCERAIKKDKLHPEPYYTLSLVYQQNGLLDMAADALRKAIYLDGKFVLAHYDLAHIYLRQDNRTSARKYLQNVQRLLEGRPKDQIVPEGDGLVVGRLWELVEEYLATT